MVFEHKSNKIKDGNAAPGRFFDGHIFDGHIIDGHIIDGTYFRWDIFSMGHIFNGTYFRPVIKWTLFRPIHKMLVLSLINIIG